jgi:hypothetical protein
MHIFSRVDLYKNVVLLLAVFLAPWASASVPEVVRTSVPVAHQVGASRVSVLVWDIYDIYLYAPEGEFDPDNPYALHLEYLRPIKGGLIAEKSVEEMRKQGVSEVKLAAWYVQMKEIFPDVDRGTELTGIFENGEPTRFYSGDMLIGQVVDPEFGPAFSLIWLGEKSSRPDLRKELIGAKRS